MATTKAYEIGQLGTKLTVDSDGDIALNAINGLIVDTNTLTVDPDNNRVGINTTSPSQALEVTGSVLTKYAGSTELAVEATGDNFPTLKIERSGGASKTDASYYFRVSTPGELLLVDETNSDLTRLKLGQDGVFAWLDSAGTAARVSYNPSTERFNFKDNVRATFGNSSDLHIYHDGTNSRIRDENTGSLILSTNQLLVQNVANGNNIIVGDAGGSAKLYYDGTSHFETTSSGAKLMTGALHIPADSSDEQTVLKLGQRVGVPDGPLVEVITNDFDQDELKFKYNRHGSRFTIAKGSPAGNIDQFRLTGGTSAGTTQLMLYNQDNPDSSTAVSLDIFMKTGDDQTSYFRRGRVGIGTDASSTRLTVADGIVEIKNTNSNDARIQFSSSTGNGQGWIGIPNWDPDALYIYGPDSAGGNEQYMQAGGGSLNLRTANTNRLTVTADGKVGINTSSPQGPLTVVSNSISSSNSGIVVRANSTNNTVAAIGERSTGGGRFHLYDSADNTIALYATSDKSFINTGGDFAVDSDTLYVDASANSVGIGTTAPLRKLHVYGSTTDPIRTLIQNGAGGQASLDLKNSSGEFRLITDNAQIRIYDQTDGADRLRIDTNGVIWAYNHIKPQTTLSYDLGDSDNRFRDIYLSGQTINMAGTKLTLDSSGDLEIKDRQNNFKRIRAKELEFDDEDVDNTYKTVLKKDNNGRMVFKKIERSTGRELSDDSDGSKAEVDLSSNTTADLAEHTDYKYFTDARARSAVTKAHVDGLNVDADTLDGINSSSFLRSDTHDTMSGVLTIQSTNDEKLVLRAPSGDTSEWNYLAFKGTDNTRDAYLGTDGNGDVQLYSDKNGNGLYSRSSSWHTNENFGAGDVPDTEYRIHAQSTTSKTSVAVEASSGIVELNSHGTAASIVYNHSNGLFFRTGNKGTYSNRVKFAADGKVGIATDSPTQQLDVVGYATVGTSTYSTTIVGNSGGASVHFGTRSDNDSLGKVGTYSSAFISETTQPNGYIWKQSGVQKLRLHAGGILETTNTIRGPATMILDPSPYDSDGGTVRIRGNLQVDGTQTIVNSTTVSINDKNLLLADSATTPSLADGAGLTFGDYDSAATLTFDASNDRLKTQKDVRAQGVGGSGSSTRISVYNDSDGGGHAGAEAYLQSWGWGQARLQVGSNYMQQAGGQMQFSSSNQKVTWTSIGNFGIGTNDPGEQLDVNGDVRVRGSGSTMAGQTVANASLLVGSSSVGIGIDDNEIVSSGSHLYLGAVSGWGTIFRVGQTEYMRLHTNGNVGIGTNSPHNILTVSKNNGVSTTALYRSGSDLSTNTDIGIISFDADYSGSETNYGKITMHSNNVSAVRGSMDLGVKSTSGNVETGLTIYGSNSGPNVGIGTTTPAQKLHVYGQTIVDGGTGVGSTGVLHVRQNGNGSGNGIALTSGHSTSHRIWKDTDGKLNFGPSSDPDAFVQDLNGDVGIGTNNPVHKLQVQGNTHTSGYFQSSGSALLRKYVSSWTNGDTHDVIYNGWNSTNSDYLYMKVPGNGTTNHGMMVLTDNHGVFFGKASQNTGAAAESTTNPMPSGSTFAFFNATNAYMAGDVGIGTNAPSTNLHVLDATGNAQSTTVRIGGDNTNGNHTARLELTESATSGEHRYGFSFTADGNGTNNLLIRSHNNNNTGVVALSVGRDNANVGIGTGTPAETLHVNGDTQIDGNIKIANDAGMYVFDDTITANSTEDIFTLANTHGAKVFTVMFSCSTNAYSVSKMYHVACAHAATPIFNKVVDTGPFNGHDFDVTFTCPYSSDNTKVGVAIINNSTTINANITTTLILGGAPTDITVTEL